MAHTSGDKPHANGDKPHANVEKQGKVNRPSDDASRAVYVISVAAELAGVHPQTLRIYERKGLLDPIRTRGGSRRFSEQDLDRLRRIQELTTAGLNLEGARQVLALEAEVALLRAELDRVRSESAAAIERAHRQHRRDLVPVSQSPVLFARVARAHQGR